MGNRSLNTATGSIVSIKDIEAVARKNSADRARLQAAQLAAEALKPGNLIDIVVPLCTNGENVSALLGSIEKHVTTPFRILICYDAESDNGFSIAQSCQKRMNIEFVKNKGMGVVGAMTSGIDYSDAPSLIIYSGNEGINPSFIDLFHEKLAEGHDMVIGVETSTAGVFERVVASILRAATGSTLRNPTSDIRIFSTRMIKEIPVESTEDGVSFNLEVLVKAAKAGYSVVEMPYACSSAGGKQHTQSKTKFSSYLRWLFYALTAKS